MYPQIWNGCSMDIRIQLNPKIRIRIRITFVSNFGVGGGLHSLLQTDHLQLAINIKHYYHHIFVATLGKGSLNVNGYATIR